VRNQKRSVHPTLTAESSCSLLSRYKLNPGALDPEVDELEQSSDSVILIQDKNLNEGTHIPPFIMQPSQQLLQMKPPLINPEKVEPVELRCHLENSLDLR
jgi:hypothetical protein